MINCWTWRENVTNLKVLEFGWWPSKKMLSSTGSSLSLCLSQSFYLSIHIHCSTNKREFSWGSLSQWKRSMFVIEKVKSSPLSRPLEWPEDRPHFSKCKSSILMAWLRPSETILEHWFIQHVYNDLGLLVKSCFGSFYLVHKPVWREWSQEITGVFNKAYVIDCGRSCQQTAGSWPLSQSKSKVENLHWCG